MNACLASFGAPVVAPVGLVCLFFGPRVVSAGTGVNRLSEHIVGTLGCLIGCWQWQCWDRQSRFLGPWALV